MNTKFTSQPYMKVNLSLTAGAVDFLSETTNGTSHFAILDQLIKDTSVTPSSTYKRGNVITLGVGQVECSVHSCCARFGIGRKKFEAIMRQMEQHNIIRMHRSRLATVADMTCITSWNLPSGSTVTNSIDNYPADHFFNGLQDSHDDMPHGSSHVYDDNADATSILGSQSSSDTDNTSASEATTEVLDTTTPVVRDKTLKEAFEAVLNRSEHRDNTPVIVSNLFAGHELGESIKPLSQNTALVQNE